MASIGSLFGSGPAGTFLGAEAVSIDRVPAGAIAVVGIPGATPYAAAGAYSAAAPAAMRAAIAPYANMVAHHDFDLGGPLLAGDDRLVDVGDLPFDPNDFTANRARIRAAADALLDRGAIPIVLGGDDSVQIPVLAAHAARGPVSVLQIDAHIDWRDEAHGERMGLSSTMRRASEMMGIGAIVQVGARSVGSARPGDVADAIRHGARLLDMRTLRQQGLEAVAAAVPAGVPVVVCLDVDGLDPSVIPAVIGRAPGGLMFGEIVEILEQVAAKAPIVGYHVVELVPDNDIGGLGALTAARLAVLGIGHAARGRRHGRGPRPAPERGD